MHPSYRTFKVKYNKTYPTAAAEAIAFQNFKASLQRTILANQDTLTAWWASPNEFSDQTPEQLARTLLMPSRTVPETEPLSPLIVRSLLQSKSYALTAAEISKWYGPAKAVNWVAKGVVPMAKSQGSCGCCWALAAATAIESAYAIKYNLSTSSRVFPQLSWQQLISCANRNVSKAYSCTGCNGGWSDQALKYAKLNPMVSRSQWPYKQANGKHACLLLHVYVHATETCITR